MLTRFAYVFFIFGACNAVNSTFDRYEITGTVKAMPQGKSFGGGDSQLTTKFSIRLDVGGSEKIVNCDSTQCASLAVDDVVVLSCFSEWNCAQPYEEECRFDHIVPKK